MSEPKGSAEGIVGRWLSTYAVAAALILLVGCVAGYALGSAVSPDALVEDAEGTPFLPFEGGEEFELTFVDLLVNNVMALTLMALGAFSLATITVFALLLNGLVIGVVVKWALEVATPLEVFLLIAPHGILEIPAMLLVAAIGLRFGHRTVRYVRGRVPHVVNGRELREALFLYVLAIGMLVVAAWIEANYTLAIAERLAG